MAADDTNEVGKLPGGRRTCAPRAKWHTCTPGVRWDRRPPLSVASRIRAVFADPHPERCARWKSPGTTPPGRPGSAHERRRCSLILQFGPGRYGAREPPGVPAHVGPGRRGPRRCGLFVVVERRLAAVDVVDERRRRHDDHWRKPALTRHACGTHPRSSRHPGRPGFQRRPRVVRPDLRHHHADRRRPGRRRTRHRDGHRAAP